MLSRQSKNIYEALSIKFDTYSLQLIEKLNDLTSDVDLKNQLDQFFIELDEVLKNVWSAINEIKKIFVTKYPKSVRTVESILNILNKKASRSIFTNDQSATKRASSLISIQVNLANIVQIIQSAWLHEEDIASFPNFDNPHFQSTYKKITVIDDPNPGSSEEENVTLAKLMTITNAAVLTQLAQNNSVFGLITFGLSFPRFAIDYETAELRNMVFLRNPSVQVLSSIWNLPERGAISKLKYFQFQWITTNRMLYIPKVQAYNSNILEQSCNSVPVRLIHNDQVQFWSQHTSYNCCSPHVDSQINSIILHFHGGGFISLSSCTTQSYTRRWAKALKIPVLSVDYSMPPESRFPSAVEDAFAVYKFIVTKLSSVCNINPKKIIIAGDSAGGNLVCALMGLIIREKLQPPAGLFLAYPACSLRVCYSPSRLHSFFTPILHPSLLYLCLKEYLGPEFYKVQNHPLASPLYLTKHFVGEKYGDYSFPSNWPRTRIMVGDQDPLFDDSLRLCQRMADSGVDVSCKIYKNLSHGFLSLQKVVARGEDAIVDSITLIQDCLT